MDKNSNPISKAMTVSEALRKIIEPHLGQSQYDARIAREALPLAEAQERELSLSNQENTSLKEKVAEQEREIARLQAALEPFANYHHVLDLLSKAPNENARSWEAVSPVVGALGQVVTVGHFRIAHAALHPTPEPKAEA